MQVYNDNFWSTYSLPDTKQNCYFIYLTVSKSEVLLKAYPLIWRSFNKWFVMCLPATSNLSEFPTIKLPWKIGIQWVTPSPLSSKSAVYNPYANSDINACIPYCILLTWNFSNMISIIPILFSVGFIIAYVKNTDLPLISLAPI